LKKLKSTLRSNRYKANIVKISNYFIYKDYSRSWRGLNLVRNLFDPNDQLKRWAEHYKDLPSDSIGHSLNQDYWANVFLNNPRNPNTWNINNPISLSDIRNTVLSMKHNKAPGPDGIPIEFYKAFFCNHDLEEKFPSVGKWLKIIFNKIWEGFFFFFFFFFFYDIFFFFFFFFFLKKFGKFFFFFFFFFPNEWNSVSIISIPKKGDLF